MRPLIFRKAATASRLSIPTVRANDVSAARVDVYRPVILDDAQGPVATTKMIDLTDLPDGMIPVSTVLSTDNRDEVGSVDKDRLRVKVFMEPGSQFEINDPNTDEWSDYLGVILPPRQVPAGDPVLNTFGVNSIQFSMGTDNRLRLKNNQTMFVVIEVTFPSSITDFSVYYLEPDGTQTPAGVDGTWRDLEISQGGTILNSSAGHPGGWLDHPHHRAAADAHVRLRHRVHFTPRRFRP